MNMIAKELSISALNNVELELLIAREAHLDEAISILQIKKMDNPPLSWRELFMLNYLIFNKEKIVSPLIDKLKSYERSKKKSS